MPRFLYIDNYRGFRDTIVSFTDVNFMVGENSTGKTSVLGLLNILSNPALFMGRGFGGGVEVKFGHYNEVVSVHAQDRSYFQVGIFERDDNSPAEERRALRGYLLTYVEEEGVPKLREFTCSLKHKDYSFRLDEGTVAYLEIERIPSEQAEEPRAMIGRWKSSVGSKRAQWKEAVRNSSALIKGMPLYFMIQFALRELPDASLPIPLLFGSPIVWIAPIRTEPRRTYSEPNTEFSSEGAHTPYVIRRMLGSTEEAKRFRSFLERVGRASGLFTSVEIQNFRPSADAPFELDVVLDKKAINVAWVGYGVSQALPIFVELIVQPASSWFAIQQPEVHLHPRAQAALGDVFFEMALQDRKSFVVETHSDFAIDRFRMNYREKHRATRSRGLPVGQVLFFERKAGFNTVASIPIDAQGDLSSEQPDSYRDFFIREETRLLGF